MSFICDKCGDEIFQLGAHACYPINTEMSMSDKKTAELLPCPFCGKLPEIFPSGSGEGTMIECQNDACVQPHTSWIGDGVALRYWNTRNWSRENEGLAALDKAIREVGLMKEECGGVFALTGAIKVLHVKTAEVTYEHVVRFLQSIRAKYATEGK